MRLHLIGSGIGLWLAAAAVGASTFTVNDELRVQFLGVTAGTNHIMPGQRLRQLHGRAPAWLKDILGRLSPDSAAPVISRTSEEAALSLWFWDASPSNRSGLRSPYVPQRVAMRLLAEDGLPWGDEIIPQRAGWPWVFEVRIYPRRQRTIRFEFISLNRTASADSPLDRHHGTLRVRNPFPFDGPFWTPQPMPARCVTNGLNLSVDAVRVNWSIRTNAGLHWVHTETVAELSWDFVRPDVRQRIRRIRLSDPTGNQIQLVPLPGTQAPKEGGGVRFWSRETLFDDDPAWRLSVDLAPRPEEGRSEVMLIAGVWGNPARTSHWDESGPLPVPTPIPVSPALQSSELVPGLGIQDVQLWHDLYAPDHSVQVNMTVTGAPADVLIRVASVEDAEGRLWLPMGSQDLVRWPSDLGHVDRYSFFDLHPSQRQTNATAPFKVSVEVLLPHRVEFLVPAHVSRRLPQSPKDQALESGAPVAD